MKHIYPTSPYVTLFTKKNTLNKAYFLLADLAHIYRSGNNNQFSEPCHVKCYTAT